MNELRVLRKKILELDKELLQIIIRRGEIVKKIGAEKIKLRIKIENPQRENELLEQLASLNCSPYTFEMIEKVYIQLFDISKELQEKSYNN
ncbi:chorismate mutase [Bacillus toyonensis]|uniref:Chorismate mutase n=1 Tax=Bacillus toyonensis TaxID=155322 RepID=A0A2A8HDK7_9BACI|nr:chorismate mutase [Bacillus toyonensis]PEQ03540.1 chorismate mutase [Bacillus toyonensis]